MHVSPSTRVRRNADIIAAGMAEETVLLNPANWTYVHFNETAARIWEAFEQPRAISDVVDRLTSHYAVDRSTCEREVQEFVDDMLRRGFITLEAA